MIVTVATNNHLNDILTLSRDQLLSDAQAAFLRKSLEREEILVATQNDNVIGFAVWNREFYEQPFLWLIQIEERSRRQGVARALITEVKRRIGKSAKLFTSTNQSNEIAQSVFESLGFSKSGIIENLDLGDPEVVYFKQL